jgi:hypothetical protein
MQFCGRTRKFKICDLHDYRRWRARHASRRRVSRWRTTALVGAEARRRRIPLLFSGGARPSSNRLGLLAAPLTSYHWEYLLRLSEKNQRQQYSWGGLLCYTDHAFVLQLTKRDILFLLSRHTWMPSYRYRGLLVLVVCIIERICHIPSLKFRNILKHRKMVFATSNDDIRSIKNSSDCSQKFVDK